MRAFSPHGAGFLIVAYINRGLRIRLRNFVRPLILRVPLTVLACAPPSASHVYHPVDSVDLPPVTDTQRVQWVKVRVPSRGTLRAAVARPHGTGPFPGLILLHGTHGFAQEYVRLAQEISRHGVLVVAACWFSGSSGAGARFVTPIECPDAPAMPAAASADAMHTVDALVQAVRALPDVRPDHVALFGHSRGGGAALHYVLGGGAVHAAVLNSAGYPRELADRVNEITIPILILHGSADGPADGGSAMTQVEMARAFEASLRQAGKLVEAKYYAGGHNSVFTDRAQHDDEAQTIAAFVRRHLGN